MIASNGIETNEYKIGGEGLFVCCGYWLIIQYLMMRGDGRKCDRGNGLILVARLWESILLDEDLAALN